MTGTHSTGIKIAIYSSGNNTWCTINWTSRQRYVNIIQWLTAASCNSAYSYPHTLNNTWINKDSDGITVSGWWTFENSVLTNSAKIKWLNMYTGRTMYATYVCEPIPAMTSEVSFIEHALWRCQNGIKFSILIPWPTVKIVSTLATLSPQGGAVLKILTLL